MKNRLVIILSLYINIRQNMSKYWRTLWHDIVNKYRLSIVGNGQPSIPKNLLLTRLLSKEVSYLIIWSFYTENYAIFSTHFIISVPSFKFVRNTLIRILFSLLKFSYDNSANVLKLFLDRNHVPSTFVRPILHFLCTWRFLPLCFFKYQTL